MILNLANKPIDIAQTYVYLPSPIREYLDTLLDAFNYEPEQEHADIAGEIAALALNNQLGKNNEHVVPKLIYFSLPMPQYKLVCQVLKVKGLKSKNIM